MKSREQAPAKGHNAVVLFPRVIRGAAVQDHGGDEDDEVGFFLGGVFVAEYAAYQWQVAEERDFAFVLDDGILNQAADDECFAGFDHDIGVGGSLVCYGRLACAAPAQ